MGKDDGYYLQKTLEETDLILQYAEGITLKKLEKDQKTLDAIVFRMIQMSEHMDKISDVFKNAHPNIKWVNIKGFRNRLVHDYGSVDLRFVFNAIKKDIPELREALLKII